MEAAYPRHYGARVALELTNGERKASAVLDPHGMPADPCTPEELLEKFAQLAGRVKSETTVAAIIGTVRKTAQLPDLTSLSALLRA